MKFVAKNLLFISFIFSLTQCSQNQAYEKLPELINQDTGLREFRFRSADCINTVYQHVPSNCDHKQQIVTEKDPSTNTERVLIRELTPDLKEKFKTVVSPTVQYDEKNGKILVSATLRVNENANRVFTEMKYYFEGDLKGFRENFKKDKSLKYIPLVKKLGASERLNGVVYCADRPGCQEVALVFSFLNPGPDGALMVDSKTFTIDSRESEKVKSDTIPGEATPRTLDIQITTVEFPEEFETDDIADPENRDVFDNVKAPVLPKDPSGALCEGLLEDKTQCPDYIYDSTRPNPIYESEEKEDEDDKPVDVFRMDADILGQIPSAADMLAEAEAAAAAAAVTEADASSANTNSNPEPAAQVNGTVKGLEDKDPSSTQEGRGSGTTPPHTTQDKEAAAPHVVSDSPQMQPAPVVDEQPPVILPTENIPLPIPRPKDLGTTTPTAENQDEGLTPEQVLEQMPAESIPIPRPRPRPEHLGGSSSSSATTGTTATIAAKDRILSVDGKFVYDISKCSQQLQRLKTGVFNQARGIYHNGSLRNARQFSNQFDINRPNPSRKSKQYGSDLTFLTVEYAGCMLQQKYRDIKIDINDFSSQNGGKLSGHSSHQNGLDVDLSYPHLNGRSNGFDDFTRNLTDERLEAALDYAKILYSTERVHILFTDRAIISGFCGYMKRKGRLTNEYKNFINNNFRHIAKHHNHYHVRLQCNSQNEFCQPQGKIRTDKICK